MCCFLPPKKRSSPDLIMPFVSHTAPSPSTLRSLDLALIPYSSHTGPFLPIHLPTPQSWPAPPPPGALTRLTTTVAKPFKRLFGISGRRRCVGMPVCLSVCPRACFGPTKKNNNPDGNPIENHNTQRRRDGRGQGPAQHRHHRASAEEAAAGGLGLLRGVLPHVSLARPPARGEGPTRLPTPPTTVLTPFHPITIKPHHTTRPCEFRRPPIMTVHAALLVQRIQALAGGSPHIVTVRAFR